MIENKKLNIFCNGISHFTGLQLDIYTTSRTTFYTRNKDNINEKSENGNIFIDSLMLPQEKQNYISQYIWQCVLQQFVQLVQI